MLGLVLAAAGIILTAVTANGAWDVVFSALIALLLGLVAFYLGAANMRFLVAVRDPAAEQAMREVIDGHPEVERYHDIRSLVVDEHHTVLVAEIELREEAMVPGLFEQMVQRRETLMAGIHGSRRDDERLGRYVTARASVEAVLARTESVIDQLTAQVRERAPQVSHVTIEVEGLAPPESASAGASY
jgi:divalent metal cation (Fe/Co/Zn/Cd) transporter